MDQQLVYDAETETYRDPSTGEEFLKCDARSARPVMLNITGKHWESRVIGYRCWLDWEWVASNFTPNFFNQTRTVVVQILRQRDLKYLNLVRLALHQLAPVLASAPQGWEDVTLLDWQRMIIEFTQHDYLTCVRSLYRQVAINLGDAQMIQRVVQMDAYRATRNETAFHDVRTWHPDRGAFTDEELETVIQFLKKPRVESPTDHGVRLTAAIALYLGKRSSQIILISLDGLSTLTHEGRTRSYLRIPKVKRQRGEASELWAIPETLAEDIRRFSARPEIEVLQQRTQRLIIWESAVLDQHREFHTALISSRVSYYFKQANLLTQRDRSLPPRPLKFTNRRARHTVGTQLAFKGASSVHIARILEHSTPASAKSYIDAVSSNVHNAINGVDRKLGGIFTSLAATYFAGGVSDTLTDRPVVVPTTPLQPLPVGSCNHDGPCRKHPFFSCYNGCPSFLAWRSADHFKALEFVEQEMRRWTALESYPERTEMILEFERLYQAILHVIERVQGDPRHD